MTIFHRVCKHHLYPTTRYCTWSTFNGTRRAKGCPKVFCKNCITERQSMMTDHESTQLGYLLCTDHYYEYLNGRKGAGMKVIVRKEKEFAPHLSNTPGICLIDSLETVNLPIMNTVASLPTTTSSELTVFNPIVRATQSVVSNKISKITMNALTLSVSKEYLVPKTFPNIPDLKKRPGSMNTSFLHNFFGLCMWGHISDGYMWMTRSDLGNDLKISVLHATTEVFKEGNQVLFRALMSGKGVKLNPNKVVSWVSNTRHLYKLGSYNKNSSECRGLYEKHIELLDMIGFPWV